MRTRQKHVTQVLENGKQQVLENGKQQVLENGKHIPVSYEKSAGLPLCCQLKKKSKSGCFVKVN